MRTEKYGWNPRIGEVLEIEQDHGNVEDPFAMVIKSKATAESSFF